MATIAQSHPLNILSFNDTTGTLILQSAAGNSNDMLHFRDKLNSTIAKVDSSGNIYPNSIISTGGNANSFGGNTTPGVILTVNTSNALGLLVKGGGAQTLNLQEWQESNGTVLAKIDYRGWLILPASNRYVLSGGIGDFAENGPYLLTGSSSITIGTRSTTNKGLIIQGATSQTANLQEWQNSAGAIRTSISATGVLQTNYAATFTNNLNNTGTAVTITAGGAAALPLIIKGATSQTANLTEWQNNSGTVLTNITSDGLIETNNGIRFYATSSRTGWSTLANNLGNLGFNYALTVGNSGSGANLATLTSYAISASTIGLVVRGAASQTADLQQWQNSSGTVLAKVDASGSMFTATAAAGTNTTQVATTAFVKTAIDNLVDSAPGTLDTLNEIAAALNDDPNFYTTITTLTSALENNDVYNYMGVF